MLDTGIPQTQRRYRLRSFASILVIPSSSMTTTRTSARGATASGPTRRLSGGCKFLSLSFVHKSEIPDTTEHTDMIMTPLVGTGNTCTT